VRAVRELARIPGIEVFANVADVRPHMSDARLIIAPLRVARGIQNKVLEGLAMAKPVVASPQALEGLNCQSGRHLFVASSALEWQQTILRLFEDSDSCRIVGTEGRRYVEQHHSWNQCLKDLASLVESCIVRH
jgi:glycosyltransferase involved in cell wall biosynthesis